MSESCIDGSMVAPKQLYPLTRRIAAWPAIAAAPTFAAGSAAYGDLDQCPRIDRRRLDRLMGQG
jgi:hypothetical protein